MSDSLLTPELKEEIDNMSQYKMCSIWRFAEPGNIFTTGEVGDYFKKVLFDIKGGFTPGISKGLGWRQ